MEDPPSKTDDGMWAYLAVSGGIQTPPMLDSRSTYLRGPFGGLDGRQICKQVMLYRQLILHLAYEFAHVLFPKIASCTMINPTINVIMGPQTKNFTDESIETFLSNEYSVSLTSDRMGYRLEGPALILSQ